MTKKEVTDEDLAEPSFGNLRLFLFENVFLPDFFVGIFFKTVSGVWVAIETFT